MQNHFTIFELQIEMSREFGKKRSWKDYSPTNNFVNFPGNKVSKHRVLLIEMSVLNPMFFFSSDAY